MSNFFKDLKLVGKATRTIESLNQQCADLQSQLDQLQTQQKEATEENELLLLQLHQVQEELEHYFLQYQDIKQKSETTEQRLDRVLTDNPNYFSFDQIECEPEGRNDDRLHWTISGLFGAGRYWETCRLDTIIEKGIAGFVFKKDRQGASPLATWPKLCEHQQEVVCIPTGTPENASQDAKVLKTLSTSDWRLVTLLPQILTNALSHNPKVAQHTKGLKDALHNSNAIFKKHIPAKLRYDKAEVIKTVTNPDYENVGFRLTNLSIGDRALPEFEFRLSCANVTRHRFGSDPKLEFPLLKGAPQFESWYAESEDEFGPKLELRFALPDAMDLEVWNNLKSTDKNLIAGLISRLPELIEFYAGSLQGEKRPASEWASMALGLERIFQQHAKFKD